MDCKGKGSSCGSAAAAAGGVENIIGSFRSMMMNYSDVSSPTPSPPSVPSTSQLSSSSTDDDDDDQYLPYSDYDEGSQLEDIQFDYEPKTPTTNTTGETINGHGHDGNFILGHHLDLLDSSSDYDGELVIDEDYRPPASPASLPDTDTLPEPTGHAPTTTTTATTTTAEVIVNESTINKSSIFLNNHSLPASSSSTSTSFIVPPPSLVSIKGLSTTTTTNSSKALHIYKHNSVNKVALVIHQTPTQVYPKGKKIYDYGHGRVQNIKMLSCEESSNSPAGGSGGSSNGGTKKSATVAYIDIRSAAKALRVVHQIGGQPLDINYHEPGSIPPVSSTLSGGSTIGDSSTNPSVNDSPSVIGLGESQDTSGIGGSSSGNVMQTQSPAVNNNTNNNGPSGGQHYRPRFQHGQSEDSPSHNFYEHHPKGFGRGRGGDHNNFRGRRQHYHNRHNSYNNNNPVDRPYRMNNWNNSNNSNSYQNNEGRYAPPVSEVEDRTTNNNNSLPPSHPSSSSNESASKGPATANRRPESPASSVSSRHVANKRHKSRSVSESGSSDGGSSGSRSRSGSRSSVSASVSSGGRSRSPPQTHSGPPSASSHYSTPNTTRGGQQNFHHQNSYSRQRYSRSRIHQNHRSGGGPSGSGSGENPRGSGVRGGSRSPMAAVSGSGSSSSSSSPSPHRKSASGPHSPSHSPSSSSPSRSLNASGHHSHRRGGNSSTPINYEASIKICNLPIRSSDSSLKDGLFHEYKKHGKVSGVKIIGVGPDRYAILSFRTVENAARAVSMSQDKQFFGCRIKVSACSSSTAVGGPGGKLLGGIENENIISGADEDNNRLLLGDEEPAVGSTFPSRAILILGLDPAAITQTELKSAFDQYGSILNIDIRKQGTVVEFMDIASASRANWSRPNLGKSREIKISFYRSSPSKWLLLEGTAGLSEKNITGQCGQYGAIERVIMDTERILIKFDEISTAQTAIRDLRNWTIKRTIQVDFASTSCVRKFHERLTSGGLNGPMYKDGSRRFNNSNRRFENPSILNDSKNQNNVDGGFIGGRINSNKSFADDESTSSPPSVADINTRLGVGNDPRSGGGSRKSRNDLNSQETDALVTSSSDVFPPIIVGSAGDTTNTSGSGSTTSSDNNSPLRQNEPHQIIHNHQNNSQLVNGGIKLTSNFEIPPVGISRKTNKLLHLHHHNVHVTVDGLVSSTSPEPKGGELLKPSTSSSRLKLSPDSGIGEKELTISTHIPDDIRKKQIETKIRRNSADSGNYSLNGGCRQEKNNNNKTTNNAEDILEDDDRPGTPLVDEVDEIPEKCTNQFSSTSKSKSVEQQQQQHNIEESGVVEKMSTKRIPLISPPVPHNRIFSDGKITILNRCDSISLKSSINSSSSTTPSSKVFSPKNNNNNNNKNSVVTPASVSVMSSSLAFDQGNANLLSSSNNNNVSVSVNNPTTTSSTNSLINNSVSRTPPAAASAAADPEEIDKNKNKSSASLSGSSSPPSPAVKSKVSKLTTKTNKNKKNNELLLDSSDDSEETSSPRNSPNLDEQIKMIFERYDQCYERDRFGSTSSISATTPVSGTSVSGNNDEMMNNNKSLSAVAIGSEGGNNSGESSSTSSLANRKFPLKHKFLDLDDLRQPSNITTSLLSKRSIFDDDQVRLNNYSEKYEGNMKREDLSRSLSLTTTSITSAASSSSSSILTPLSAPPIPSGNTSILFPSLSLLSAKSSTPTIPLPLTTTTTTTNLPINASNNNNRSHPLLHSPGGSTKPLQNTTTNNNNAPHKLKDLNNTTINTNSLSSSTSITTKPHQIPTLSHSLSLSNSPRLVNSPTTINLNKSISIDIPKSSSQQYSQQQNSPTLLAKPEFGPHLQHHHGHGHHRHHSGSSQQQQQHSPNKPAALAPLSVTSSTTSNQPHIVGVHQGLPKVIERSSSLDSKSKQQQHSSNITNNSYPTTPASTENKSLLTSNNSIPSSVGLNTRRNSTEIIESKPTTITTTTSTESTIKTYVVKDHSNLQQKQPASFIQGKKAPQALLISSVVSTSINSPASSSIISSGLTTSQPPPVDRKKLLEKFDIITSNTISSSPSVQSRNNSISSNQIENHPSSNSNKKVFGHSNEIPKTHNIVQQQPQQHHQVHHFTTSTTAVTTTVHETNNGSSNSTTILSKKEKEKEKEKEKKQKSNGSSPSTNQQQQQSLTPTITATTSTSNKSSSSSTTPMTLKLSQESHEKVKEKEKSSSTFSSNNLGKEKDKEKKDKKSNDNEGSSSHHHHHSSSHKDKNSKEKKSSSSSITNINSKDKLEKEKDGSKSDKISAVPIKETHTSSSLSKDKDKDKEKEKKDKEKINKRRLSTQDSTEPITSHHEIKKIKIEKEKSTDHHHSRGVSNSSSSKIKTESTTGTIGEKRGDSNSKEKLSKEKRLHSTTVSAEEKICKEKEASSANLVSSSSSGLKSNESKDKEHHRSSGKSTSSSSSKHHHHQHSGEKAGGESSGGGKVKESSNSSSHKSNKGESSNDKTNTGGGDKSSSSSKNKEKSSSTKESSSTTNISTTTTTNITSGSSSKPKHSSSSLTHSHSSSHSSHKKDRDNNKDSKSSSSKSSSKDKEKDNKEKKDSLHNSLNHERSSLASDSDAASCIEKKRSSSSSNKDKDGNKDREKNKERKDRDRQKSGGGDSGESKSGRNKNKDSQKKKRRRVIDESESSDSETERKPHSIFEVVVDEYVSMYDKVKSRSNRACKAVPTPKGHDDEKKLKDQFHQLKKSRAKREEKKRSTSIEERKSFYSSDEDNDGDHQPNLVVETTPDMKRSRNHSGTTTSSIRMEAQTSDEEMLDISPSIRVKDKDKSSSSKSHHSSSSSKSNKVKMSSSSKTPKVSSSSKMLTSSTTSSKSGGKRSSSNKSPLLHEGISYPSTSSIFYSNSDDSDQKVLQQQPKIKKRRISKDKKHGSSSPNKVNTPSLSIINSTISEENQSESDLDAQVIMSNKKKTIQLPPMLTSKGNKKLHRVSNIYSSSAESTEVDDDDEETLSSSMKKISKKQSKKQHSSLSISSSKLGSSKDKSSKKSKLNIDSMKKSLFSSDYDSDNNSILTPLPVTSSSRKDSGKKDKNKEISSSKVKSSSGSTSSSKKKHKKSSKSKKRNTSDIDSDRSINKRESGSTIEDLFGPITPSTSEDDDDEQKVDKSAIYKSQKTPLSSKSKSSKDKSSSSRSSKKDKEKKNLTSSLTIISSQSRDNSRASSIIENDLNEPSSTTTTTILTPPSRISSDKISSSDSKEKKKKKHHRNKRSKHAAESEEESSSIHFNIQNASKTETKVKNEPIDYDSLFSSPHSSPKDKIIDNENKKSNSLSNLFFPQQLQQQQQLSDKKTKLENDKNEIETCVANMKSMFSSDEDEDDNAKLKIDINEAIIASSDPDMDQQIKSEIIDEESLKERRRLEEETKKLNCLFEQDKAIESIIEMRKSPPPLPPLSHHLLLTSGSNSSNLLIGDEETTKDELPKDDTTISQEETEDAVAALLETLEGDCEPTVSSRNALTPRSISSPPTIRIIEESEHQQQHVPVNIPIPEMDDDDKWFDAKSPKDLEIDEEAITIEEQVAGESEPEEFGSIPKTPDLRKSSTDSMINDDFIDRKTRQPSSRKSSRQPSNENSNAILSPTSSNNNMTPGVGAVLNRDEFGGSTSDIYEFHDSDDESKGGRKKAIAAGQNRAQSKSPRNDIETTTNVEIQKANSSNNSSPSRSVIEQQQTTTSLIISPSISPRIPPPLVSPTMSEKRTSPTVSSLMNFASSSTSSSNSSSVGYHSRTTIDDTIDSVVRNVMSNPEFERPPSISSPSILLRGRSRSRSKDTQEELLTNEVRKMIGTPTVTPISTIAPVGQSSNVIMTTTSLSSTSPRSNNSRAINSSSVDIKPMLFDEQQQHQTTQGGPMETLIDPKTGVLVPMVRDSSNEDGQYIPAAKREQPQHSIGPIVTQMTLQTRTAEIISKHMTPISSSSSINLEKPQIPTISTSSAISSGTPPSIIKSTSGGGSEGLPAMLQQQQQQQNYIQQQQMHVAHLQSQQKNLQQHHMQMQRDMQNLQGQKPAEVATVVNKLISPQQQPSSALGIIINTNKPTGPSIIHGYGGIQQQTIKTSIGPLSPTGGSLLQRQQYIHTGGSIVKDQTTQNKPTYSQQQQQHQTPVSIMQQQHIYSSATPPNIITGSNIIRHSASIPSTLQQQQQQSQLVRLPQIPSATTITKVNPEEQQMRKITNPGSIHPSVILTTSSTSMTTTTIPHQQQQHGAGRGSIVRGVVPPPIASAQSGGQIKQDQVMIHQHPQHAELIRLSRLGNPEETLSLSRAQEVFGQQPPRIEIGNISSVLAGPSAPSPKAGRVPLQQHEQNQNQPSSSSQQQMIQAHHSYDSGSSPLDLVTISSTTSYAHNNYNSSHSKSNRNRINNNSSTSSSESPPPYLIQQGGMRVPQQQQQHMREYMPAPSPSGQHQVYPPHFMTPGGIPPPGHQSPFGMRPGGPNDRARVEDLLHGIPPHIPSPSLSIDHRGTDSPLITNIYAGQRHLYNSSTPIPPAHQGSSTPHPIGRQQTFSNPYADLRNTSSVVGGVPGMEIDERYSSNNSPYIQYEQGGRIVVVERDSNIHQGVSSRSGSPYSSSSSEMALIRRPGPLSSPPPAHNHIMSSRYHPEAGLVMNDRQRQIQVQTPPHASQVPPQGDSLLTLLQRYPIMWQGLLALKNDNAVCQMHFVSGNLNVAKDSFSLPHIPDGSIPALKISQRMRLETAQLEGVTKKMQLEAEHCMLLALPCGRDHMDVLLQSNNLRNGFITYLQLKQAAGIVNIMHPVTQQPTFVIHIFPSCDFANENLARIAPDLLHGVADIAHLLIVVATV